jgi:Holliday junction resolvase RusA-like endonuclease
MILHLDITPRPAPRLTQNMLWTELALNYKAYKQEVQWLCKKHDYKLTGIVKVMFIMPMPEYWSKKKRLAMNGTKHEQKPDTDNLFKAFTDSFGKNDSHVHEIHACKRWGERGQIILFTGEHL